MPRESINVLPITADMNSENEKMNLRTIIVIDLSSVVLLLVLVGAFYIILKWRKIRRPSSVVGPAFTNYKQEIWYSFELYRVCVFFYFLSFFVLCFLIGLLFI